MVLGSSLYSTADFLTLFFPPAQWYDQLETGRPILDDGQKGEQALTKAQRPLCSPPDPPQLLSQASGPHSNTFLSQHPYLLKKKWTHPGTVTFCCHFYSSFASLAPENWSRNCSVIYSLLVWKQGLKQSRMCLREQTELEEVLRKKCVNVEISNELIQSTWFNFPVLCLIYKVNFSSLLMRWLIIVCWNIRIILYAPKNSLLCCRCSPQGKENEPPKRQSGHAEPQICC